MADIKFNTEQVEMYDEFKRNILREILNDPDENTPACVIKNNCSKEVIDAMIDVMFTTHHVDAMKINLKDNFIEGLKQDLKELYRNHKLMLYYIGALDAFFIGINLIKTESSENVLINDNCWLRMSDLADTSRKLVNLAFSTEGWLKNFCERLK